MLAAQIQKKLKQAVQSDSSWIVMHSSLMHLKFGSNELQSFKWEFLKALRLLVEEGYQFAFPAFTFSFTKSGIYTKNSASEVGVLADWVSELLGSKRTHHPIYSHVLLGNDIQAAMECSTKTCFGENSIYQFFEQKNANIMMLGCDWSYCTAFHYYEQKFTVPYRYEKRFESNTELSNFTDMFVRDENLTVKNDFSLAIKSLQAQEKIFTNIFAQGELQSIAFQDFANQCNQDLSKNIYAYVRDSGLLIQQLADKKRATKNPQIKIAVLAESNYEPLLNSLRQVSSDVLPQHKVEFLQNDYGQMVNDVLSGKIDKWSADFCFLPSRLEDLLHLSDIQFVDDLSYAGILPVIDSYIGLIKQLSQQVNRLVLVNLFSFSSQFLGTSTVNKTDNSSPNADKSESDHVTEIINKLNQYLHKSLMQCSNVRLLPVTSLGMQAFLDARLWYLGKIPYTNLGFDHLAQHYMGLVAHECGASIRMIVLDLDNTLWGGVLGEDGLEGIQLGGDFPGNAFKDFQRTIIALYNRGIALAIASKNDTEIALTAIKQHPHMLIKEKHLASFRIDWNEKAENIRSMAEEVGLSLSNIMFVDDNPLECEKVRKLCPEVKVIELPKDPVEYKQVLMDSAFLKIATTTVEDSKRANQYAKQRQNKIQAEQFQSLDDYFASLNIHVRITEVNDGSFNRAVQLTNKTNQFNTTTQRFTDKQLKDLLNNDSYQVMTVSYQDNSTEEEVIGLMVLNYQQHCEIELMLLSCRVLGRSIETAMLAWLEQRCVDKGISMIQGAINITERNTPVRDVFSRHGFVSIDENIWQLEPLTSLASLASKAKGCQKINKPDWLTLQAS